LATEAATGHAARAATVAFRDGRTARGPCPVAQGLFFRLVKSGRRGWGPRLALLSCTSDKKRGQRGGDRDRPTRVASQRRESCLRIRCGSLKSHRGRCRREGGSLHASDADSAWAGLPRRQWSATRPRCRALELRPAQNPDRPNCPEGSLLARTASWTRRRPNAKVALRSNTAPAWPR